MPGKTYLNVPPFAMAFGGFEGPVCVLGGPTSPIMGSHPERGQRQRILSRWRLGAASGRMVEPEIWPLGYSIAAI